MRTTFTREEIQMLVDPSRIWHRPTSGARYEYSATGREPYETFYRSLDTEAVCIYERSDAYGSPCGGCRVDAYVLGRQVDCSVCPDRDS